MAKVINIIVPRAQDKGGGIMSLHKLKQHTAVEVGNACFLCDRKREIAS